MTPSSRSGAAAAPSLFARNGALPALKERGDYFPNRRLFLHPQKMSVRHSARVAGFRRGKDARARPCPPAIGRRGRRACVAPWTTSTDYDNGPCAVGVGSYHRPSTYLARPPAWVPPAPGGPAALRVRAEKEIAELYVASVRARKFGGQLGLGIRGEARELQGATTRSTASRSPFALKLGG